MIVLSTHSYECRNDTVLEISQLTAVEVPKVNKAKKKKITADVRNPHSHFLLMPFVQSVIL